MSGPWPPWSIVPAAHVLRETHRSPLRYPGGKTWLLPHVRHWLRRREAVEMVEAFAGGASVALCAVAEGLVRRSHVVERNRDLAAFWRCATGDPRLCNRIIDFDPTPENVMRIADETPATDLDAGFRALVLNRTRHNGIIADNAGFIRRGEDGRGIASRWYPETLVKRVHAIQDMAVRAYEADGLDMLDVPASDDVAVFLDPPYTEGGSAPGRRLYDAGVEIPDMLRRARDRRLNFLATLDANRQTVDLVRSLDLHAVMVRVGHAKAVEMVVTPAPLFGT